MAVRAPHLYRSLRCFCLAGFSLLAADVEDGAEIPFSFEEHAARGNASLYEYRPLVRSYVDARAERLSALADAGIVLEELRREPAAAIYAAAHAGKGDVSLLRTIALPLLADVAEACGGLDWSDEAFDRAYAELERTLLGERRTYAAVAPLVGISVGAQIELAEGLRVRLAAAGELAAHWPEAIGALASRVRARARPALRARAGARRWRPTCPSRPIPRASWPMRSARLRLATAGPIAAGPVLFERLDWRPLAVRPVLPIAAAEPRGEPTRLDAFRARLASDLLVSLGRAEDDPELAEALDRWELSLFADEPFRSEQLREALSALARRHRRPLGRGGAGGGPARRDRAGPRRAARAPSSPRSRRAGRSHCDGRGSQGAGRGAGPRRPGRARGLARRRADRRSPAACWLLRRARLLER